MLTRDTRHKHSEIQKSKEKRYTRETLRSLMQVLLGYPEPSCLLSGGCKEGQRCLPSQASRASASFDSRLLPPAKPATADQVLPTPHHSDLISCLPIPHWRGPVITPHGCQVVEGIFQLKPLTQKPRIFLWPSLLWMYTNKKSKEHTWIWKNSLRKPNGDNRVV